MRYKGQTEYDHQGKIPARGILITNLGTPDAPDTSSVRRYLREFLSDPRVVEIPRVIWWLILHLFILPFRPGKSAKLYRQIWTENGSPLMDITSKQKEALQKKLDSAYGNGAFIVEIGMRYGQPSISHGLQQLKEKNVNHISVLPLYPQYSAVTTGSTFDELSRQLSRYRWIPGLTFINGYHQDPAYITALADSIRDHINQHGVPDKLLFSFHGTPLNHLHQGDPYFCFCSETTRLVSEQLELEENTIVLTFQSRFGKATWLQPYTAQTLEKLATEQVKKVAVICPGFSADCLETIEEIDQENRDIFLEAGGDEYYYIPCLNDNEKHIDMMMKLVTA
jgi:ferrochelatase